MPNPTAIKSESLGCRVLTFLHLITFLFDTIVQAYFIITDLFLNHLFQLHIPRILMEVIINYYFSFYVILNQHLPLSFGHFSLLRDYIEQYAPSSI